MKKYILFFIYHVLAATLNAQSVGVGTTSPTSTLEVNGSFSMKIATITASITLDSTHAMVLCNNPTSIIVTLPTAVGITGRIYHIKRINAGPVTIVANSGQNIDGAISAPLMTRNSSVQLISDGSSWFMINSISPHSIGEDYGGGLIFYVDGTGQHGLISASADQPFNGNWGCTGTSIPGAQGTGVGTGLANTAAIIASCAATNAAARLCNDLVLNGYSDWYLPSKDELNLMYVNLKLNGFGNFNLGLIYWSSTEINANQAWFQNFVNGSATSSNKSNLNWGVHAIRAF